MIIRCPSCSTTYRVDGSVFDAPQPTFRCSRCKHIFAVQIRLQLRDEEPPVPDAETAPPTEAEAADYDPGTAVDSDAGETDPLSRAETDDRDAGAVEADHEPDAGSEQGTLGLAQPAPADDDAPPAMNLDDDAEMPGEHFEEVLLSEPDFELPELNEPEPLEPTAAVDHEPPSAEPGNRTSTSTMIS